MRHLVYGNGESRRGFPVYNSRNFDGVSWGCNAIYRHHVVDNLVVIDYAMQGEVYESGYARGNRCHFADWKPVPSDPLMLSVFETMFSEEETYRYGRDRGSCVVNGSERSSVERNIEAIKKDFPHLDAEDLAVKMRKNVGLHIIYNDESVDKIEPIVGIGNTAAGTAAVRLACREGATEVYMFGFDLSSYGEPINNIYKGTSNYHPRTAKGFDTSMWVEQLLLTFRDYPDIKFNWVGGTYDTSDLHNVNQITYDNIRLT